MIAELLEDLVAPFLCRQLIDELAHEVDLVGGSIIYEGHHGTGAFVASQLLANSLAVDAAA